MGRLVTNHAMLLQLDMLTKAIYRGSYTLDTFRYQPHNKDDAKNQVLNNSSSLSKINSLKGFCSSSKNTHVFEQMEKSLDYLSSMIIDVKELVVFLTSYPCMHRQPYSMHLLLDNCMFGRQMEAERIINFLLQTQPHGAENLEVLPIIGPGKVGNSTLVAHVCKDERVLGHFSEVIALHDHDFTDHELVTLIERCETKHQNQLSNSNKDRRVLFVVELVGDLKEVAWNMLYSASKRCVPRCSKIIVTSRSDKIKNLGTTEAVTLNYLSHEAYWYFFKTLTFGSINPEMHPRLAYVAMEIARVLNGRFLCIVGTAYLLRDNFEIHFWSKILAFLRRLVQKHVLRFGEHPFDLVDQNRISHHRRMVTPSEYFVVYRQYECPPEEVPMIRTVDLMYGSIKCHGKFEALAWRSPLPPYYSYVYTCEIQEQKSTAAKRKRSMKIGVTLKIKEQVECREQGNITSHCHPNPTRQSRTKPQAGAARCWGNSMERFLASFFCKLKQRIGVSVLRPEGGDEWSGAWLFRPGRKAPADGGVTAGAKAGGERDRPELRYGTAIREFQTETVIL
ncbi:hypothetical protein EJB05_14017, partial [Eragrostis curvula]